MRTSHFAKVPPRLCTHHLLMLYWEIHLYVFGKWEQIAINPQDLELADSLIKEELARRNKHYESPLNYRRAPGPEKMYSVTRLLENYAKSCPDCKIRQ